MTDTLTAQRARKRAKRAEEIKDAADAALLLDLKSKDDAVKGRALKIHSDRALERIEVLQAELDALKKVAGNTADLDAAVAAKTAAESELEQIKKDWSDTLNFEVRKVQDEVRDDRAALSQRDDAALTTRAFDYLSNLVRRIETWEPTDFFNPEIPKSPWVWRTWMPESKAKLWCAWEVKIAAMPREKQVDFIAVKLHTFDCMYCAQDIIRRKPEDRILDLSPEFKEFLTARMRSMDVENEVFGITHEMTEFCRRKNHPMPAQHVDFKDAERCPRDCAIHQLVSAL
jgi:hypothetical protein